jgi:hypothetical protein
MATQVTEKEFIQIVGAKAGSKILAITYRTPVVLRKKIAGKNQSITILKIDRSNVSINFDYEAGVYRRLEKEGKPADSFTPGKSWHVAVLDEQGRITPFAQHPETGKIYFRCQHIQKLGSPAYFAANDQPVDSDTVVPFLAPKRPHANQGLDAPLQFRTIKFENILAVEFAGESYDIIHQGADETEVSTDVESTLHVWAQAV